MPRQRRHGLATLQLSADPDACRALAEHLLAGRKTVVVRPVTEPDHEPLERAGERALLVDAFGRSVAVADVVATRLTTLDGVDAETRRADDPDQPDARRWTGAQLARWRTSGLLPPDVTDVPVAVVGVRVVGLETPSPASAPHRTPR